MKNVPEKYQRQAEEALGRAIAIANGVTALGRALGITAQSVHAWRFTPAEQCRGVEKATGVTRYELRPDVFGTKAQAKRELIG